MAGQILFFFQVVVYLDILNARYCTGQISQRITTLWLSETIKTNTVFLHFAFEREIHIGINALNPSEHELVFAMLS